MAARALTTLLLLWACHLAVFRALPKVACSALPATLRRRDDTSNALCVWKHPRCAIIRDTLYVDGGWIYNYNQSTLSTSQPDVPNGQVYTINFTRAFTLSSDSSSIFQVKNAVNGASNNLFPIYYDGTMFANDAEYILYGGLVRPTAQFTPPSADAFTVYEQDQYGPQKQAWAPGFINGQLPSGITRYVTAGAGVSAPSENLGFYFSGLHGTNWGNISSPISTSQSNATLIANTLISVDMSIQRSEKWTNDTLPESAVGRISAEAVWIPVSQNGAVIIIGGVSDAESVWHNGLNANQTADSKKLSPGYMKTVLVYDVAGKKWYSQDTSGDTPPQLAEFCSIVATAKDNSSHNVYIYGGYDALSSDDTPSDDVYILSIPSFIWVKASTGTVNHGRNGHKCVKPYPDQMLVVGGNGPTAQNAPVCLGGGAVQIFNLNNLTWQTSYDPAKWSQYEVPSIVTAKIGGNGDGGATSTAPSAWSTSDLSTLFGTKYSKTIQHYYPYSSASAQPTRISTAGSSSGSSLPKWVGPVLGVVLGLIFILSLISCLFLWRRHRERKSNNGRSSTDPATGPSGILAWIRGVPGPTAGAKAPTVTETETEDMSSTAGGMSSPHSESQNNVRSTVGSEPIEAHGTPIVELEGSPGRAELADSPQMQQVPFTSGLHPRPAASAAVGIPRAESPTVGGATSFFNSIDSHASPTSTNADAMSAGTAGSASPPSHPVHRHSHNRSISSESGVTPTSEGEERDRIISPVSPPDSARTSVGSSMLGRRASANSNTGAGGTSRGTRRQSSFGEILEKEEKGFV